MLKAFAAPGHWLKGNLHTHTTNSDGRLTPEERVAGYKEQAYDFLALTDHGFVTRYPDDDLIVIPGSEWVVNLDYRAYHLVALNVPAGFHIFEEMAVQESVDEILSAGGLAILAHPYWSGLTLPDMRNIQGCLGIEIYNTTTRHGIGKGCSTVHWDDLLAAGWRGFGFAVDDCHFLTDAYGGWIMVKSEFRDADSILGAIKAGRFYASSGPEIKTVIRDGDLLRVECSDAAEINFICRASNGRHIEAPDGDFLTAAEFELSKHHAYARIEIVDASGRVAWTNPLFVT
jgi:hypothetical protein